MDRKGEIRREGRRGKEREIKGDRGIERYREEERDREVINSLSPLENVSLLLATHLPCSFVG